MDQVKEEPRNPFLDAPNAKKMMTVIGLYLAVIANMLVSNTNSVMLPAAAADIGGTDIYGLAQGVSGIIGVCAMPIYGFIGARNPASKRLLAGGSLVVGALVLLIRGIATNMFMIIAANIFWGLVSAGVFAIGFTMIRDIYDKKQAGLYLGLVGTMMSIGILAGPFVGGLVIDQIGWRVWCFILFAFLALGAILILMGVKVKKEEVAFLAVKGGKFDFAGAAVITIFLGCLIIALSMGSSYVKFGTPLNTGLLVVSVIALIVLVFIIRKKKDDAIVPLNALKDRNTLVLTGSNFLHNFGAMSISFFIPGFIMRTLATDPIVQTIGPALAGGLSTSLMAVLGLFLGPVFGRIIAKQNTAKWVMTFGNVWRVLIMGAFVLVLVPGVPVWVIYILTFLGGFFNSQQTVTQSAAPQIMLKANLRTLGNSVIQLGQNLGAGVGMAVFTLLVAMDPATGMRLCMIVSLVAWIVLLLITFLLKKPTEAEAEAE